MEIKMTSDWLRCILVILLNIGYATDIRLGYAIDDIGGGTRETIEDLKRWLRSRYFASVLNERASFTS